MTQARKQQKELEDENEEREVTKPFNLGRNDEEESDEEEYVPQDLDEDYYENIVRNIIGEVCLLVFPELLVSLLSELINKELHVCAEKLVRTYYEFWIYS